MFRSTLLRAALSLCTISSAAHAEGVYSDADWNTAFIDNCGLPNATSVEQVTINGDAKLQFTLGKGDKGKCRTDAKSRHRAPYWERAELAQQSRMDSGQRYRISAEVTFLEGFTGEREAFFQIHASSSECKKANPPLMMKFNDGLLSVETLRGVSMISTGKHRNVLKRKVPVTALYGKPVQLAVDFDNSTRPGRISVSLAGNTLITDEPLGVARCAQPYVKFGVYRPGGKGSGMSRVVFDDLRVERVE